MGVFLIQHGNIHASLHGNKDRNIQFHTDHRAAVTYLHAIPEVEKDLKENGIVFSDDEVIAPGVITVSRIEAEAPPQERIVGFSIPKFSYPIVVGNCGREVTIDLERIALEPSNSPNGPPATDDGIRWYAMGASTSPLSVRNVHGLAFRRALQKVIVDTVQELRSDKNKSSTSYAAKILRKISREVVEDATVITAHGEARPNLLMAADHLPDAYHPLEPMGFLKRDKRVALTDYDPTKPIKTRIWPWGKTEGILLNESYGESAGAYPLQERMNERQVLSFPFEITPDTIDDFCRSINMTRETYEERNRGALSPVVAAYIAIDPLVEYCELVFPDSEAIVNAKKKSSDLEKADVQANKVYVGQSVVCNASIQPPFTGTYTVVVALTEPVRVRSKGALYFEDIRLGYLVITPEREPYALGEAKVRRAITPATPAPNPSIGAP